MKQALAFRTYQSNSINKCNQSTQSNNQSNSIHKSVLIKLSFAVNVGIEQAAHLPHVVVNKSKPSSTRRLPNSFVTFVPADAASAQVTNQRAKEN